MNINTKDCPRSEIAIGLKWFNKQNDWSILAHVTSEHAVSVSQFFFTKHHHKGRAQMLADCTH